MTLPSQEVDSSFFIASFRREDGRCGETVTTTSSMEATSIAGIVAVVSREPTDLSSTFSLLFDSSTMVSAPRVYICHGRKPHCCRYCCYNNQCFICCVDGVVATSATAIVVVATTSSVIAAFFAAFVAASAFASNASASPDYVLR